jgi:NADPH:quinone reductase-like Zn-dependent oxidoreductase
VVRAELSAGASIRLLRPGAVWLFVAPDGRSSMSRTLRTVLRDVEEERPRRGDRQTREPFLARVTGTCRPRRSILWKTSSTELLLVWMIAFMGHHTADNGQMRAAVIEAMKTLPVVRIIERPDAANGEVLVKVSTAGLNPTDLVASTGVRGNLPVPYVAGTEGVGRLQDGRRVYFAPTRLPHGSIAEYAPIRHERAFTLPDGLSDADALGIGIAGSTAWLAMSWKGDLRPGESVLVLGATGSVGQIAVQAARLLGASKVVAAGRNRDVLESLRATGVNEVVVLENGYEQRLIDVADGGFDLVIDSLFAAPMAAALRATKYGGRIVNLGMRAGRTMELSGLAWKGRDLLNYNLDLPPIAVYRAAYERLAQHVLAGELVVKSEVLPMSDVAVGWQRQAQSPNTKLVLRI